MTVPVHSICPVCSNGCNLFFHFLDADAAEVTGYECRKGLAFAEQYLHREMKKKIFIANTDAAHDLSYSFEALARIASHWNIRLKATHPEINILGSPERINFRTVIESDSGELFKLEKIFSRTLAAKTRIAQTLDFLHGQGLSCATPTLKTTGQTHIVHEGDSYWQIAPFISAKPLNRLTYIFDGWRGNAAAGFLIALDKAAQDVPHFDKKDVFSLPQYIGRLAHTMKTYEAKTFECIVPILGFLETEFFSRCDKLPVAFAHGDFHPLNIIWGEADIRSVIDWEFAGYKPQIYDAANMIGCLGVENPQSLQGDFVAEFVNALARAEILVGINREFLLEFIVAQRFAWLSEWLRKKDTDMVELEAVYMKLLIDNKEVLKDTWQAMAKA